MIVVFIMALPGREKELQKRDRQIKQTIQVKVWDVDNDRWY